MLSLRTKRAALESWRSRFESRLVVVWRRWPFERPKIIQRASPYHFENANLVTSADRELLISNSSMGMKCSQGNTCKADSRHWCEHDRSRKHRSVVNTTRRRPIFSLKLATRLENSIAMMIMMSFTPKKNLLDFS